MGRDGQAQSFRMSVLWSFTWALGIALGVAIGGWLTAVGGAGAPGVEGLDVRSDLVVVPTAVFAAVFVVEIPTRAAWRALRRRTEGRGQHEDE